MTLATILRKQDCEVVRTPEELIAWIESVDDQFRADDRIEKRLIKAFFEEIRPLGHLARHKYLGRLGLYLRPKIGDQNYDAEVIDRSFGAEKIARVEFVSTYRDYNFALRMEHLDQHGDVYMTGYVGRNETKASRGQVYVVPEFVDHQTILDELVATMEGRVAQKISQTYTANTILTVVFDDFILNMKEDIPQLELYFRDALSIKALHKFCGFFILGVSGRTFWEFGETIPT